MKTSPLPTMNAAEAAEYQFALVDTITRHFKGAEFLNMGDLGVVKSTHTRKAEECLADFFGTEDAVLLRGAGTGALRWGFYALIKAGGRLLVHDAPVYPTTQTTVETMGLRLIPTDFHKLQDNLPEADAALVQYARQHPEDSYDMAAVLKIIKGGGLPTLCDDNYVVMKTKKISAALGADMSAFSLFKLLGPEGLGCVVGKKSYIQKIQSVQYSGGSQVQGYEAMDALRSLVYAPVALALQSAVIERCAAELQSVPFVKNASIANAQSKVLLVEFFEDIAEKVLVEAQKLGALPHPVGAESRYEVPPLFYRVSGTFLKADPGLKTRMIRINPNRAGSETVLRILDEAYRAAKKSSNA